MSLELDTTHLVTFLLGAAIGAAGHYFGEKYTDRRRTQESKSERDRAFRRLEQQMPDLFRAIHTDLRDEPTGLLREFFVLPKGGTLGFGRPHFEYNESEIESVYEKVKLLVSAGFVDDITGAGAPKFRLSEDLVERLRKEKWQ